MHMTKKKKRAPKRDIVGLTQKVVIFGKGSFKKSIKAKIDTGATKSSIDARLAAELQLGPVLRTRLIKSAHGNTIRPIVEAKIKIAKITMVEEFSIADRTELKYPVLIGQNILRRGRFMIDPMKK